MAGRAPHLEPSCLYPDEAEIARLVLGPKRSKAWPGLAVLFERQGMPKVDPQTGGRYWPKVKEFLDRRERLLKPDEPLSNRARGIVENFDYEPPKRGRRMPAT